MMLRHVGSIVSSLLSFREESWMMFVTWAGWAAEKMVRGFWHWVSEIVLV